MMKQILTWTPELEELHLPHRLHSPLLLCIVHCNSARHINHRGPFLQ